MIYEDSPILETILKNQNLLREKPSLWLAKGYPLHRDKTRNNNFNAIFAIPSTVSSSNSRNSPLPFPPSSPTQQTRCAFPWVPKSQPSLPPPTLIFKVRKHRSIPRFRKELNSRPPFPPPYLSSVYRERLSSTSALLPPKRRRPRAAAFTPAEYQASLRRGRPSMKIERRGRGWRERVEGGSRAKWPLSVRTVSGSGSGSKSRRINSRHAGYAALSRIIGYFVVPATSPYGICYGKDLRILFRLLRLPFPSRGEGPLRLSSSSSSSSRTWV